MILQFQRCSLTPFCGSINTWDRHIWKDSILINGRIVVKLNISLLLCQKKRKLRMDQKNVRKV